VKTEFFSLFEKLYDEKIIPALQKTPGCLYASLMQSAQQKDECISMTLWESPREVEEYEKSGAFQKLLDEAKPYFADSTEWKIQLSKDMKLEYEPVPEEPTIKSYQVAATINGKPLPQEENPRMYVRIVSAKIQPGKWEEAKQIYATKIIPALKMVKGCRYAYLIEAVHDHSEGISVTIWDHKEDADNYESSGLFDTMKDKLKHTFSGLYQWKMALEKEAHGHVTTSEDLNVKNYSIVTGKNFQ
jgi:quinol monooxygenase YgiN